MELPSAERSIDSLLPSNCAASTQRARLFWSRRAQYRPIHRVSRTGKRSGRPGSALCWPQTMLCKTKVHLPMLLRRLCHWLKQGNWSHSALFPQSPKPVMDTSNAETRQVAGIVSRVSKKNLPRRHKSISTPEYYWNSGMFMFKAGRYLAELQNHRPDIVSTWQSRNESEGTGI